MDAEMDAAIDAVGAEASTIYLYCMLASAVLFFYDNLITLDGEVSHIWKRRFTVATLLFLLNRYLYVALSVVDLLKFFPPVQTSVEYCKSITIISGVLLVAFDLNSVVFSAFRIWAIWGRNWTAFSIIFCACLAAPCINIYRIATIRFITLSSVQTPYGGCIWNASFSTALQFRLTIAARVCSIFADTLIIGATLMKTFRIKREAVKVGIPAKLTTLLIRDGSVWWLALLGVNVVNIIFDYIHMFANPATFFVNVMRSIMLSRFILSLRSLSDPLPQREWELSTGILGDLGDPVSFANFDDDDLEFTPAEELITTRSRGSTNTGRRLTLDLQDAVTRRRRRTVDNGYSMDRLIDQSGTLLSPNSEEMN
ncbi:unnamed protein product [Somion occarium]|uniref:DUF6533 domain-containing protein n=1 Tax=Somion occarium TaxID=3059160 RepID=A0ABP1CSV0_9APHY